MSLRVLLLTAITLAMLSASGVYAQGTQIPENDRRQPPPRLQDPPKTERESELGAADFLDCYNQMDRPLMAVVAVLNMEHGDALVEQRAFVNDLGLDLGRRFSSVREFRMIGSGVIDAMREDPEYQRRVNANPGGAAQLTAEKLGADLVIVLLCRPTKELAGGVTEYACSFEILDNRRNDARQLGGRSFTLKGAGVRTGANERRQLIENYAKHTTNQIVTQLNGRCGGGNDGAVADELIVRLSGAYQDQDIAKLVEQIRRLESVDWISRSPRIESTPPSIEFDLTAYKSGADLGTELSSAIFMAIQKDAQFVKANATHLELSIQDPIYSTWMGPRNDKNKDSRAAFQRLYREKGSPQVLLMTREVSGTTDRVVVPWYWYYEILPAVEPNEAIAVRNAGGAAVRSSFGRTFIDAARIRPMDALPLGMNMTDRGVEPENMNSRIELVRSLKDLGVQYMVDLQGTIDLRNNRDKPMTFSATLYDAQTGQVIAFTDSVGCSALAGDPVMGAECATDIGNRLAAQTLDMLRNAWLDNPDWMRVVIADASTAREADRIQEEIESVDGVEFVTFRAFGTEGLILEVAHFGADRDIRKALEQGDLPFGLEVSVGTTSSVLQLQLR